MPKLSDKQRKEIGELVGQATMQWEPIPAGEFKSVEAAAILEKIIAVAERDEPFTVEELGEKLAELFEKGDNDADSPWCETWHSFEYLKDDEGNIEGFGKAEFVESYGGEGMGDERWIVFKVGDRMFRKNGYYSSWDGSSWDGELEEVEPREVTVTQYFAKKEG